MTHSTLLSATTSIFEELALLLAVPDAAADAAPDAAPDAANDAEPLAGGVRVAFAGPLHGALTVHVTAGVLDAVAANMLGRHLPPDDASGRDSLRRDALGELANVLCGTLLPALAGRRAEFRLSPPAWLGTAAADAARPVAAAALALEGGRAEVRLYVAGGAGAESAIAGLTGVPPA